MTETTRTAPAEAAQHDPLAGGFPASFEGRALFWLAVAFSLWQIAFAAHIVTPSSQVARAVHVGFLLALGFPLLSIAKGYGPLGKSMAYLLAACGVAVAAYQWVEYTPLLLRAGDLNTLDLVFGVVLIVTVFTAAWLLMGPALPIISGSFLAYAFFGQYLPSPFNHRGYAFEQVIEQMSFGTEGIYGIPTYVSATYIFLFILFGSFLEKAGMIKLFHRCFAGACGRPDGRRGQGVGAVVWADGHDLGLGRGQCRHHRAIHDSADETLWLSVRFCRRGGGHGLDGRGRSCRR